MPFSRRNLIRRGALGVEPENLRSRAMTESAEVQRLGVP